MRRVALAALCSVVAGCGVPLEAGGEDSVGLVRDAIVGGTVTTGDPNVFMLIIQGNNGQGSMCTATLIERRSLITAAHCVDPSIIGATSTTIIASNAPTESQVVWGQNTWRVTETRTHPSWNPNTLTGDIAMALLDNAPPVTPKAWNNSSLSGTSGQALRAVGYGTTGAAGTGSGVKRTVDLTIRQLTTTNIYLGNQSSRGICHGDSGGPSFHTFSDGVERIIGVHSFTLGQDCVDGADTRVDVNASFVQTWLQQKEAPSCGEDGRCVTNCATPDIDCVCKADGQCTTTCPNLLKDPDCDPNCVANNICAQGTCPAPDSDCVAEGEHCTSSAQCLNRKCVVDAQHPTPYCSRPCSTSSQCGTGMECDPNGACRFIQRPEGTLGGSCTPGNTWCGPVGVCTGSSSTAAICAVSCARNQDCAAPQQCLTGFDGTKYCVEPPPALIFLQNAHTEGKAAPGACASAPGLMWGLGALLLGLRRRRR